MTIKFKATVYCDHEHCSANQTVLFNTNSFIGLAAKFWALRWSKPMSKKEALCPVHSGGTNF